MLVGYMIKLIAVLVLYAYMYSVNKKRDREAAAGVGGVGGGVVGGVGVDGLTAEEEKEAIDLGMHDATELDNKGFRYTL